jgi:hypothetical protein
MENLENKPEEVKVEETKVEETKVEATKTEEGFFSKLVKNRRDYRDTRK